MLSAQSLTSLLCAQPMASPSYTHTGKVIRHRHRTRFFSSVFPPQHGSAAMIWENELSPSIPDPLLGIIGVAGQMAWLTISCIPAFGMQWEIANYHALS